MKARALPCDSSMFRRDVIRDRLRRTRRLTAYETELCDLGPRTSRGVNARLLSIASPPGGALISADGRRRGGHRPTAQVPPSRQSVGAMTALDFLPSSRIGRLLSREEGVVRRGVSPVWLRCEA